MDENVFIFVVLIVALYLQRSMSSPLRCSETRIDKEACARDELNATATSCYAVGLVLVLQYTPYIIVPGN